MVRQTLQALIENDREIHLEHKVMEVLVYLAEHAGEVVPKQRIADFGPER